jgi:hypothetical protein
LPEDIQAGSEASQADHEDQDKNALNHGIFFIAGPAENDELVCVEIPQRGNHPGGQKLCVFSGQIQGSWANVVVEVAAQMQNYIYS